MNYSANRKGFCETDITPRPKPSQAKILPRPKPDQESDFGRRLRQAFGGAGKRDIGRQIDYSASQMTSIFNGSAFPSFERLIKITEITKCNLHWLITGEGEEQADPLDFMGEAERKIVRELAEGRGVEVQSLVGEMVSKGLAAQGAELFGKHPDLDADERRELKVIAELLLPAGVLEPLKPKKK